MDIPPSKELILPGGPDAYQYAALTTAQYLTHDKPAEVLFQGLNDEIIELLEQAYGDEYWTGESTPPEARIPLDEMEGELGDLLWYGSQILLVRAESLSEYISAEEWREHTNGSVKLQNVISDTDWYSQFNEKSDYDFINNPVLCLALLAVQLSDVSHGRIEGDSEFIKAAIQDLFAGISIAAAVRGLSLEKIAAQNLHKLVNRKRKPHTITHVEENLPSLLFQKKLLWLASLSVNDSK